jgi:hypothetical protein
MVAAVRDKPATDGAPPTLRLPLAPTFTFTPKEGDQIVFPPHAAIRGEIEGTTLREFFWDMDREGLSFDYQVFRYLARAAAVGATEDMQRQVVRLPDDELRRFFREWVNAEDDDPEPVIPPES